MDTRKHVISFSAGKDSVAMVLHMHELGEQIDEIIYYDVENWNWPQCDKVIKQVESILGREIIRIKGAHENHFDWYMCYKTYDKGANAGTQGASWPARWKQWCTSEKARTMDAAKKKMYPEGYVGYIGYCLNEKQRAEASSIKSKGNQKNITYRFPLIEWGWTEEDSLAYCYSRGIDWDGLYNHVKRISCFCCPFQGVESLRILYKNFPESWKELERKQQLVFDYVTGQKWVDYKAEHNVFEWSNRFRLEEKLGRQITKWKEVEALVDKEDLEKGLEELISKDPKWKMFDYRGTVNEGGSISDTQSSTIKLSQISE